MKNFVRLVFVFATTALGFLIAGCETDSAEQVYRQVDITVEGYYTGSPIVSQNTGAAITSLNLRQAGDQLEAIDNNNSVFSGTIGQVTDSSIATFTITGLTTVGNEATISGSITVEGTQATMRGTWIEDSLFGSVYATASVPTNSVSVNLSLSPTTATLAVNESATFTVSGGASTSYSWSLSSSTAGSLNTTTGSSVSYTASTSGTTQTISVTDGTTTKTATVTQP